MKPSHIIAPTLSILAAGFWLQHQESALGEYEKKARDLKAKIGNAAPKAHSSPSSPTTRNKLQPEFTSPDGTIDWLIAGPLLTQGDQNTTDPSGQKFLTKFLLHLKTSSPQEIETALAQIDDLALSTKMAQRLKGTLIATLAKESPAKALSLTGNAIAIASTNHHLRRAQRLSFFHLSKNNPSAALTWLDDQIKKGHLKATSLYSANNPRFAFEAPLIKHLAETNLPAAGARISQLSSEEKSELFRQSYLWNNGSPPSETFLNLARLNLPESQITNAIHEAWYPRYHPPTLKNLSQTLEKIPLTDQEHSSLLRHTIQAFTQANPDPKGFVEIYHWSKEQAPDQSRENIVSSILNSAHNTSIEQAFQTATQLAQTVEDSPYEQAFQTATQLAQTVEDPQIQTEFAHQFFQTHNRNLEEQLSTFQSPALANELRQLIQDLPTPE